MLGGFSGSTAAGALPSAFCELIVAMPVCNEADSIAAALNALEAQTDPSGRRLDPRRYEVLVLANNCSDETAAIARRFGSRHPRMQLRVLETTLSAPDAHVGAARRLVMDEALARLSALGRARGVIASTDGDTQVCHQWVTSILAEIETGADAVGGRIWSCEREVAALEPGARLRYRLDNTYRTLRTAYESVFDPEPLNPWPRHDQYFGASMAATVEAYRAVGGLPAVPMLEDMAFARALERVDARVRHSRRVRVQTSLRRAGRVPVGLSTTLNQWTLGARAGEHLMVESAAAIERLALDRRRMRFLWNSHQTSRRRLIRGYLPRGAESLGLDKTWLEENVEGSVTFGILWQAIMDRQRELGVGHRSYPGTEIGRTIADLRARFAPWRVRFKSRRVQRDRVDTAPAASPANDTTAGQRPLRVRGTIREPDHPSKGNPGQMESSEPAANGRLAPAG